MSFFGFGDSPQKLSKITDFTALPTIIFATTFFILVWSWIKRFVASNGPIQGARTASSFNNKIYGVFALSLAIAIARSVLLGAEGMELAEYCKHAYHFSKFYAYLDVLFLVANGSIIGPYMAFHHISVSPFQICSGFSWLIYGLKTPFFTYFRVLHALDWQLFAFLNCIHHVLLCSYLSGATNLRSVLPYTQYLQLGGGILLDAIYFLQHGSGDKEESTGRAVSILLLLRYTQLYGEQRRAELQQKPKLVASAENSVEPISQQDPKTAAPAESKKRK